MIRLRLAVFGLALFAASASAAPFDLEALRAAWPESDAVYLDRSYRFSMPSPDVLRVETTQRLAVLSDTAQDDLGLFAVARRPGCREPSQVALRVLGRDDTVVPWDGALLELPDGNHPVDAGRGSSLLSTSRRGIAAGALLEESWVVDYHGSCFDGYVGSERLLIDPVYPTVELRVDVPCAGDGCFAVIDMPFDGALVPAPEGGLQLRAHDLPALPSELRAPDQVLPAVVVASSDDPLVAGRLLAGQLGAQAARTDGAVLESHRDAVKQQFGHVEPRAVRVARYLAEGVERLDEGAFWQFGADWGGPVRAGRRPMLPLEWWALGWAMTEELGAIPLLLDTSNHLPPAPIGRVVNFDRLGFLLPGHGVLLDSGWFPTVGGVSVGAELKESQGQIAGMWALLLPKSGPVLARFPVLEGLEEQRWSERLSPTAGDKLLVQSSRDYLGVTGAALRTRWLDRVQEWEEDEDRSSASERDKEFAREEIFGHAVGRTSIETDPHDPSAFSLRTSYSEPGLVQRGGGVVVVAVPTPVNEELYWLVPPPPGRPRALPFELTVTDDHLALKVDAPEGTKLAGLPPSWSLDAGPVSLRVDWSRTERGAQLAYRLTVTEPVVAASEAEALGGVGEALRQLSRIRLLFVPE